VSTLLFVNNIMCDFVLELLSLCSVLCYSVNMCDCHR